MAAAAEKDAERLELSEVEALIENESESVKQLVRFLCTIIEKQSTELEKMRKMVFGRRSERMPTVDDERRRKAPEPKLTVDGEPMPEEEEKKKRERRRHARKKSEDKRKSNREARKELVTEEVDVRVRPAQLPEGLTLEDFRTLGEGKVVERIEYVPGRFVRFRYHLETLLSKNDEHIVRATPPPGVGKGVQYGPGFHAHVVSAKCADIMPLNRVSRRLGREGVAVARSVLCSIFHRSADKLSPIYEAIHADARCSSHAHADETPFRVQAKGGCRRGWIWTLVTPKAVVYRFDPSRDAKAAEALVGPAPAAQSDEPPTLSIDGYSGYNSVTDDDGRQRCGCWAHARRKVFESLSTAPHAAELMELIGQLFDVEHEAALADELGTGKHLARRHQFSTPVVDEIDKWVRKHAGADPPSFPLSEALGYLTNQRDALRKFLDDPKVPLTNNIAERALRCIAMGRRSFLFAGHDEGAQNLAILQTVVGTCTMHGVNPEAYLTEVLPRLGPGVDIEPLLPWNWSSSKA